MVLCAYMHLFNNVVLADAVTAVLIIPTGFHLLNSFHNKVCINRRALGRVYLPPTKVVRRLSK